MKKQDRSGDKQPLTANPFDALAALKQQLPENPPEPVKPLAEIVRAKPKHPFSIQKTRKGGLPVSVERRAGGKVVTIIGNVEGNAEALLNLLKKRCGAGGAVRENAVELQGDHRNRIESILEDLM